ncbi:MAG TPA: hypothetical protein VM553_06030 [Dongiaceae bacterium]|nr:hypothetical protein [Dongiaceae bacterium]
MSLTLSSRHFRLLPTLALTLLAGTGAAHAGNLGVAGKISSLGYGLEADYILSDKFSVRGQFNTLDYDDTFKEDGINYDGTLDLSSFGVLLDWHPFGGGFRVTAGGFSVDNEVTGVGSGSGTYEIGDATYVVEESDNLKVDALIELGDGFKPYVGLGWGHSPSNKGGLLLSVDVGLLLQDSPSVDLTASGTATDEGSGLTVDMATDPTVQEELRKEEQNLEDDLKDLDIYPVISLGVGWRF